MSVLAAAHVECARPGLGEQESVIAQDATIRAAQSRRRPDHGSKDEAMFPRCPGQHGPALGIVVIKEESKKKDNSVSENHI